MGWIYSASTKSGIECFAHTLHTRSLLLGIPKALLSICRSRNIITVSVLKNYFSSFLKQSPFI
jgi:hypothetical protein